MLGPGLNSGIPRAINERIYMLVTNYYFAIKDNTGNTVGTKNSRASMIGVVHKDLI